MKALVRILTIVLLFFTAQNAFAQRGGDNVDFTERAQKQTDEMTEALSLSDKQAEKVGKINLKYAEKMKKAREEAGKDENTDWSAMRENMQAMREKQKEEMKGVLTAAQFEKWQQMTDEQMKERRDRRSRRNGIPKPVETPKDDKG